MSDVILNLVTYLEKRVGMHFLNVWRREQFVVTVTDCVMIA